MKADRPRAAGGGLLFSKCGCDADRACALLIKSVELVCPASDGGTAALVKPIRSFNVPDRKRASGGAFHEMEAAAPVQPEPSSVMSVNYAHMSLTLACVAPVLRAARPAVPHPALKTAQLMTIAILHRIAAKKTPRPLMILRPG